MRGNDENPDRQGPDKPRKENEIHEVARNPQQVPAGAELLVGAAFGNDAIGRPLHGALVDAVDEADGGGNRRRLEVGTS